VTNLFDLTGKVALVTGGNSGVGLGFARALAAHGADVAIWGTNETKNAAAADELRATGRRVLALRCDVGDHEAVGAAMDETVSTLGRLDACFVNAGVPGRSMPFVDFTMEEWRRVMRVNLDGAFSTAQAAVRAMKAQFERDGTGGSIVFSSSGSAFQGQQKGQHYGASKAGINAMMAAIAVEHARHAIRANSLVIGWTESEMTAPAFAWKKFADNVMPRIPMRRWGTPADLGGVAVYLTSDASSWHTGDIIRIDGGYTVY
jgi:NAD(P)-dependent dehydrogenase (short-subunit alcohol dehydrogenase family)